MIGEQSPRVQMLERLLAALGPDGARAALAKSHDALSNVELAALGHMWAGHWARPAQIEPAGPWLTWFLLTARGWGKTAAAAQSIIRMIERGEVREMGMAAQNDVKTYDVNVLGLIDASPPRFVPKWIDGEAKLLWPNGAVAYAYSPEAPQNIRSKNLQLCWLSELQSWPTATREEAYINFRFATRKGGARMIVDATPKAGHPILIRLLKAAEKDPRAVRLVRGSMRENYAHLAPAAVRALIEEFEGTTAGREELDGEMSLEAAEAVTVTPELLRERRRAAPARYLRRVISVDPATTSKAGSDTTGLVDLGLGTDRQAYVIANRTGKHTARAWGSLVIDMYLGGRCDCVVVETNKGGELVAQNIRAEVGDKGIAVEVLGKDERVPPHNPRVIYVREVYARRDKSDRAKPVTTAYERGRVWHVEGANLASLETTLTTWVDGPRVVSPGDLDALVHGVVELLGLATERVDHSKGVAGIMTAQRELMKPRPGAPLTSLLAGARGRGRTI
jgi:phage terminase large subunit-like protein